MEKYGFVYIWYDRFRKMFYIGCHWGTENDGYICSSSRMKKAYKRRPEDFKRRIVQRIHESRINLLEVEHKWLQLIPDEELGIHYYNHSKHHFGHWTETSDARSIGQKISESKKGRSPSEETKLKMRISHLGHKVTEETRIKIGNGHRNKIVSIESRTKMREAHKRYRERSKI